MNSNEPANGRVLIVDDQKEIHDDFVEMLNAPFVASANQLAASFVAEENESAPSGFELLHARSGEEALEIVRAGQERGRPVAVAYVDIRMPPGQDGIETIRCMREIDRDVEVVIMTAYTDRSLPDIIQNVEPLHKVLYVRKPFAPEEIQQITLALVEKWNVERNLAERRRELAIGHQRMEAVLNASGVAMAMYDLTGRLAFANRGYEELAGMPESALKVLSPDALTAHFEERFRVSTITHVGNADIATNSGDLVEHMEHSDATSEKQLFYRVSTPVHDGEGAAMGHLQVYRDVSRELELERVKAEVARLRAGAATEDSFDGMIGTSPLMQDVYALMRQVAERDTTVLIRGESGTGKELLAKLLHSNSPRKDRPFVAINCAAVPANLVESELFGHERGAFTGAGGRRIGAFERASGGTMFLDEIGDMEPLLQAKLLRVLQEREVQRVGGSTPVSVDIRLVVATNKNLEAAVEKGEFREDLLYRISVFPIVIPPLRQRRGDIPLLADHFLKTHAERTGQPVYGISTGALRLLFQYHWPGNVRELDHAMERAVLLEKTDVLQSESLPPHLVQTGASANRRSTLAAIMADVERQELVRALAATSNNVTQAALALGIDRATLYRKLKTYGLSPGN